MIFLTIFVLLIPNWQSFGSDCVGLKNDCNGCVKNSNCRYCLMKTAATKVFYKESDSFAGICFSKTSTLGEVAALARNSTYCGLLIPDYSHGLTCGDVSRASLFPAYRQNLQEIDNTNAAFHTVTSSKHGSSTTNGKITGSYSFIPQSDVRPSLSPYRILLWIIIVPSLLILLSVLICCCCIPACRSCCCCSLCSLFKCLFSRARSSKASRCRNDIELQLQNITHVTSKHLQEAVKQRLATKKMCNELIEENELFEPDLKRQIAKTAAALLEYETQKSKANSTFMEQQFYALQELQTIPQTEQTASFKEPYSPLRETTALEESLLMEQLDGTFKQPSTTIQRTSSTKQEAFKQEFMKEAALDQSLLDRRLSAVAAAFELTEQELGLSLYKAALCQQPANDGFQDASSKINAVSVEQSETPTSEVSTIQRETSSSLEEEKKKLAESNVETIFKNPPDPLSLHSSNSALKPIGSADAKNEAILDNWSINEAVQRHITKNEYFITEAIHIYFRK